MPWLGFQRPHIIKCVRTYRPFSRTMGTRSSQSPRLAIWSFTQIKMGTVVHHGVVCGFLADETVLVESKWGVAGRYIHFVDDSLTRRAIASIAAREMATDLGIVTFRQRSLAGKCDSGASSESSVPNGVELSSAGSSFLPLNFLSDRRMPQHFPSLTRRVLITAQHQNLRAE